MMMPRIVPSPVPSIVSTLLRLCFCALAITLCSLSQSLTSPARISQAPSGELLVTDYLAGAIFALDSETLEVRWASVIELREPGRPLGIAQVGEKVLVSDETSKEVLILRWKNGKVKTEGVLGRPRGKRGGTGLFERPHEIAVDREQNLVFVLDVTGGLIRVFDGAGRYLYKFAPAGPNPSTGQIDVLLPSAIAVDEQRKEILVSDYGDPYGTFQANVPARVLIFTYAGFYLGQINGDGVVNGEAKVALQFARPQGLAVDPAGRIYLVDCYLGEVFVFDRHQPLDSDNLALLGKLGSFGTEPGQLNFPLDVVVDVPSGDVFVTNNRPGRIEVFRGGLTSDWFRPSSAAGP
jgi:DNA-binding beta-propeller fold protein YncE